MNQGRKLDNALVQRIQRMHNSGSPKRTIARVLGVSYNTVSKYSDQSNRARPPESPQVKTKPSTAAQTDRAASTRSSPRT
ncbi:helix-turn-helix domain-containing protein [Bremerella cremea]|uniref:helix-turn-helix domain-containing protein n=1 Tax=Bremerella cremea TaxID=1031537 RepID=UPI0011C06D69|nr:helix-turn-helix domain-containing protein [Bremerella cremea]